MIPDYDALYQAGYSTSGVARRIHHWIQQWFNTEEMDILDAGCGHAVLRQTLKYKTYTGVDITDTPLPKGINDPRQKFHVAPLYSLPFEDEQFDLAISTEVLEHIDPQYLDRAINELIRVSKVQVITVPYYQHVVNGQKLHLTVEKGDWWQTKLKKYSNIQAAFETDQGLWAILSKEKLPMSDAKIIAVPDMVYGQRIRWARDGSFYLVRPHAKAERYLNDNFETIGTRKWMPRIDPKNKIEHLAEHFKGKQVYLVGKGPSLDSLTERHFPNKEAMILCINESIKQIKKLDLPNEIFGMQIDAGLRNTCDVGSTILVSQHAWAFYENKPYAYHFVKEDYGNISAECAIKIARKFGASRFTFLAFDAATTGNTRYAKSLGVDPERAGSPDRFLSHRGTMIAACGDCPYSFVKPKE